MRRVKTREEATAYQRLRRQRNKDRFGVCEPKRRYAPGTGRDMNRHIPDPEDYSHPDSDVSVGP